MPNPISGDNTVIIFPRKHWQSILDKRGTSPEEKGYWFGEYSEDSNRILSMFQICETTGSETQVSSLEEVCNAIFIFTSRHPEMRVIPYHTHPLEEPSPKDRQSYIKIYESTQGRIQNFLTIGPQTVQLSRVYNLEYIGELVGTHFLKIIKLAPKKQEEFMQHGKILGKDFLQALKEAR